jgi:ribosomal protein L11 methyltransferase
MRAFCVTVDEADEDEAVAALWDAGTAGIEVKPATGGRLQLLAYFPEEAPAPSRHVLPPGALVEATEVPDVDWVARFRHGFHAFRAGRFLIAPAWDVSASPAAAVSTPTESSPGTTEPLPGAGDRSLPHPLPAGSQVSADTLIVDPGRAFGTGTHETTRLCLSALEGLAARRALGRTLDLGAGTGLLAVAAVRLGASFVCASDLDPEANLASRHHARLNGVHLAVVRADGGRGFQRGSFDLVLANLMALLLADRAAEIAALLAPGGALVLSGLLVEDVPFVRAAFEQRPATPACGAPSVIARGEWAALVYENCSMIANSVDDHQQRR